MIEQQASLIYDEVISVEDIGLQQTYDFVVPQNHNFIANSILVHNSGHIESDADAVVFIHRPDYYDRNIVKVQGRPSIGKLIIAKERQGGKVGAVPVIYKESTGMYYEVEEMNAYE
jgi:replicative DNA helicase